MTPEIPKFDLQYLARGYCPVTEQVKSRVVTFTGSTQNIKIGNTVFSFPQEVTKYSENGSVYHILDFKNKEQYQQHMKQKYGLGNDLGQVVQVEPKGRWLYKDVGSIGSHTFSSNREIHVAKLVLSNPNELTLNREFNKALHNLPNEYNNETKIRFQTFFSSWGTHTIVESFLGGLINICCSTKGTSLNATEYHQINVKVHQMLKILLGDSSDNTNYNYNNTTSQFNLIGIIDQKLDIRGGEPDLRNITLDALTPERLRRWADSVPDHPQEIHQRFTLFPHSSLLDPGERQDSLFIATKEYLGQLYSNNAHHLNEQWQRTYARDIEIHMH